MNYLAGFLLTVFGKTFVALKINYEVKFYVINYLISS